ncbi:MAG: hypothetical protein ACRBN8_00895 [Nannocystales bacterium]
MLSHRLAVLLAGPLLGCVLGLACGDDTDSASTPSEKAAGVPVAERLLAGEPLVLLEILAEPHASVRDALGPHALTLKTSLTLRPTQPHRNNPAVDTAVAADQAVSDTVALRWEAPDDAGPRFALEQHNDKDRGRSVVALDGTLYAKLEHRPWTFHAVESNVHELWLDDSWRAAHDAVAFLMPGAAITANPAAGEGWNGGDAVRLRFEPGQGTQPPGASEGWRSRVAFSALSGDLLVDANSGAWISLDATATYSVTGGSAGPLSGQFEVHGRVAPTLPEAPSVVTPQDAVALPERHRYEEERKRLLGDLAAP